MCGMKKYIVVSLIIISIVLAILMCVYLFPQVAMFIISAGGKKPPQPQITYGEFPFELEYEIDGQIIKVEDVVVCKYDGVGFGDNGKFLKWKKWILSTNEEDLLLLSDGNIKVYCTVGNADYYMGENQEKKQVYPKVFIRKYENSLITSSADPLELAKYNIKILRYAFSDPIENIFE